MTVGRQHFLTLVGVPISLLALSTLAASTGTILVTGTIPITCSIAVAPQTSASSLDLSQSQTALLVANVTESCNDGHGYKVTMGTVNGSTSGAFRGTAGNADTLSYTVTYNGNAVNFVAGSAQVTNVSSRSPVSGIIKPLAIAYTGGPGLTAGTYTDTLTLALAAN